MEAVGLGKMSTGVSLRETHVTSWWIWPGIAMVHSTDMQTTPMHMRQPDPAVPMQRSRVDTKRTPLFQCG